MALPDNLGFRVDCFMTQGYLTGKSLRTPALDGSISAKFLLETKLKSESFEALNDLLIIQVQKL